MVSNSWPTDSEFCQMMQAPKFAFREPEYKELEIERNNNRQPKPRAGNFAVVYKGLRSNSQDALAMRVFRRSQPDRCERYQKIDKYLLELKRQNKQLKSLVHFRYFEDGIRVNSSWWPLVVMDWVPGQTLFKWLEASCQQNQSKDMSRIADLWVDTIDELKKYKIAHGDLQQDNVMVTNQGELKLVDYDCMCVPELVGYTNLELGVVPYQHPERNSETKLSSNLDRYSSLMIYVAVRALAANAKLWQKYIAAPAGGEPYDKLLFKIEDFKDPTSSELLKDLARSPDDHVRRLTAELVELRQCGMDQVPALDEMLFSFANVQVLLNQRDFDGAVDLLTRNKKQVSDAPPALQPVLRNAQERICRRVELEKAVAVGDEASMQRLYTPSLLDDYPQATQAVSIARNAGHVIPLLNKLATAKQRAEWRNFVQLWDSNQKLLAGRKSTEPLLDEVKQWRERNSAADLVLSLIAQPSVPETELVSAWERLARVGGHPETQSLAPRVQSILIRQQAWNAFQAAIGPPSETVDRQIASQWNEALFAGWQPAEAERPRLMASQRRLQALETIAKFVASSTSRQHEEELAALNASLGASYRHTHQARLQAAEQRIALVRELERAFATSASESIIADVWNKLVQAGGDPLVDTAMRDRAQLAQRRHTALVVLKRLPPSYTMQQAAQFDKEMIAAWDDSLFAQCAEAVPWRPAYESAVARQDLLSRLNAAVAAGDAQAMIAIRGDARLTGYPLPHDVAHRIDVAARDLKALQEITAAIKASDPERLMHAFDAKLVRQNQAMLVQLIPDMDLPQLLRTLLRKPSTLKLCLPVGRQALAPDVNNPLLLHACWDWPERRFTDHCRLAVVPRVPGANVDPIQLTSVFWNQPVERDRFEKGLGQVRLQMQSSWKVAYVVVWARIDTGFEQVWSEPLMLGRVGAQAESQNPRKSWFS